MEQKRKEINLFEIQKSTDLSNHWVQDIFTKAKKLETDPEKEKRLAQGLCKCCYYLPSRMGGAAITSRNCGICGKYQSYASTYTDTLCLECAKEYSLCKHCNGTIDLRSRRKFEIIERKEIKENAI